MKNSNKVECPKCLSTGEVMEGKKESKGFQYINCTLCYESGVVSEETVEDYLLSINEDLIDDYD